MTDSMADRQATAIGPAGTAERPLGQLGSARAEASGRGRVSLFARLGAEIRFAPVERKFLYVLLLLFLAKGIVYTLVFPAFSGHDEVAHYTYIRFVAEEGRVPIMPDLGEWQARTARDEPTGEDRLPNELYKYCQYFTSDWWRGCSESQWLRNPPRVVSLGTDLYPSGWVYTANHPPFYYLLMTPLYWLSSGQTPEVQLYLFRLIAIPFGLLTVVFAYLTTRTLFPGDQFLATTVPAFVAFQPQIAYEAAMLNNDILAIAFTSWVLYLVARGLRDRFPLRTCVLLGFVLGLAVLTKGTSVTAAPIIAFALFFGLGWRNVRQWLPRGALITAITLVMIWPWYLFLYAEYGDLSGLTRVKELQWWNYTYSDPPTVLGQLFDGGFAWLRWRETWGEFGWRLIPLTPGLLLVLLGLCIFAVVGLAIYAVRVMRIRRAARTAAAESDPEVSVVAGDPVL
ncbi:MAG: glycosyltransferase family 39 protein, partial [Chloroflexia bacterium]|nr:glycosyltransferase family 39 protein [Chloroflexia bacterium]